MAAMDNVSMEQEIIKIIEEVLKHKITKEMLTMRNLPGWYWNRQRKYRRI